MKNLLYISLIISIIVIILEIRYLGESSLAFVIMLLAVAIGLQGYYLLNNKK